MAGKKPAPKPVPWWQRGDHPEGDLDGYGGTDDILSGRGAGKGLPPDANLKDKGKSKGSGEPSLRRDLMALLLWPLLLFLPKRLNQLESDTRHAGVDLQAVPEPSEEFKRRADRVLQLIFGEPQTPNLYSRASRRRYQRSPRQRMLRAWQRRQVQRPPDPFDEPLWFRLARRLLPKAGLAAVMMAALPMMVWGAGTVYYIGPSGNDTTGAGTSGSPWASMDKAYSACAATDVIRLLPGTYTQANSLLDTTNQGSGRWSGNKLVSEITIENDSSGNATLVRSSAGSYLIRLRSQASPWVRSNPSGGALQFDYTGSDPSGTWNFGNTTESAIMIEGGAGAIIDAVVVVDAYGPCIRMKNNSAATLRYCNLASGAGGLWVGGGSGSNGPAGLTAHDNQIHDQDVLICSGLGADVGAVGIFLGFGAHSFQMYKNDVWDCHSASPQYGIDGGAFEIFGGDDQGGRIFENRCWNNNGFWEDGRSATSQNFLASWRNKNIRLDHNLVLGMLDFQWTVGRTATVPLWFHRAGPDMTVDHNTWDVDNGHLSGGFVLSSGGSFQGDITNTRIHSNCIQVRYDVYMIQAFAFSALPAGFYEDYNLFYKTVNTYGAGGQKTVVTWTGAPAIAYSTTGLAAWRATGASGRGQHDKWGSAPAFVDVPTGGPPPQPTLPDARNYRPNTGSPLIDAGELGTDIGALSADASAQVADDPFTRTTTSPSLGVAPIGGVWSTFPSGASTISANGTHGVIGITENASRLNRAALLSASATDVDVLVKYRVTKVAGGTGQQLQVQARQINELYGYGAVATFQTSGSIFFELVKLVNNVQTSLVTAINTGLTRVANDYVWIRLNVAGVSPTVVRGRVWKDGTTEPTTWTMQVTDADANLQTAGGIGIRTFNGASTNNQPFNYEIDSLTAVQPNAPPPSRAVDFDLGHPHTMAFSIKANRQIGPFAVSHGSTVVFTMVGNTPVPVGRLKPNRLAKAPVGSWNRTDPQAVDDDPDAPDALFVALTGGKTGKVSWGFEHANFVLDATADHLTMRAALTNPDQDHNHSFVIRVLEEVGGSWVTIVDPPPTVLAAGTSVVHEVAFSKSDLTDQSGDHVGIEFEPL